jgi:hypothetical protein
MAPKATFDADFGKFVSELTKVDVKLREFEPSADRASARLQRMADSLNGNKLLEQAGVAVGAISRIEGGVAALNNGELRKYGTLIDAATEKLVRQGRDVPPALAQVKSALDQARQSLDENKKSATEAGGALAGITGAIGQGLGIGAGLGVVDLVTQGVGALKSEIGETIAEGQKLTQLRTAFEQLQGGPAPAAAAMADLRTATRGLVSDINLLEAANKASLLGLGEMGIKTDELASIAVRLGKAMGQEAAKSVDDLTTALARQSPQILDNLGIKVDLEAANVRYAASLGKTAVALTDEERKLAFASAAMDAARAKADTLGESQLTLSDQIGRVGNTLDSLQGRLGASAQQSSLLSGAVGTLADRLDDTIENVEGAWSAFRDADSEVAKLYGGVGRLTSAFDEMGRPLTLVVLPALGAVNEAAMLLEGTFDRLRGARDWMNGSLSDVQLPSIGRDRELLDPTAGQGTRAQNWLAADEKRRSDEYQKAQEEALRKLEQGEQKVTRRIDQLAEQRRERLRGLTGRDELIKAQQLIGDVFGKGGVGLSSLSDETVLGVFDRLADANAIAKRIEPGAAAGIASALAKVATHPAIEAATRETSCKVFEKMLGPDALRAASSSLAGQSGATLLKEIYGDPGDFLPSSNPLSVAYLAPTVTGLQTVKKETDSLRTSLTNVSQAFANLSQVSGGLGPVAQQVGVFVAGLDTAEQLVTSIGQSFNKNFKFGDSRAGQNAAAGIAGGLMGWEIGTGSGLSPWRAAGVGAIGGAAAGVPLAAATLGGSVAVGAIVGATTAYFGAQKAQSELRKAKDLQAEALVAQYGTLDALLETVGALGLSQQSFLEKYYGEPKEFAKGVNDLNNALTREKNTADALGKSLQKVQDTQGVLSRGDRAQLVTPRAGGPVEGLAEQFKGQQTESLLGGLDRILQAPGALSASLVKSVGQSFPAALSALEQQGASPLEALKTLMPLLDQFRAKAVEAGMGSTPGFDALNGQLAILKDERLGPLIERASGAGQALGALNNLDLLDDETFSGFAASITESVAGMDLLSDQGQNAMRLIRGPLQNVWQLQQDFGFAVAESTQLLLDQAGAAGLIGDKFRPAEEKLLLGIDRVVDRLDTLIGVFADDLVTDATAGAETAGRNILNAFEQIRPRIQVGFEYDTPNAAPGLPPVGPTDPARGNTGSGASAARQATQSNRGGDIYLDGEQVGYHTLRHAGDFADLIGA